MKIISSKICLFVSVLFFLQLSFVFAANVSCTNITSNLFDGMSDPSSGNQILSLQNFLSAQGYLKATPNGHFGPATFSSVIAFQVANNISPTGYVGQVTRAAITAISCKTSSPTSGVGTPTESVGANVIAPTASSTLSLGQTYTIAWNGVKNTGYDIVLENQNGISQGFITPNMVTSGSYSWQVGQVLSSATNSYSTVSPGTYQIHFYNISGGAPDIWSNTFTIVAPPLTLSGIIPTTVSLASGNSTVALFGSGLNTSPRISIDGYYNFGATILYTSVDGTIIVFSMPSGVSLGSHSVIVSNNYGSVASEAINVTQ